MRLIEIDELKKNIDEKIGDFPHRKMLFNVIDNQPTAYDIDKVVEQLEENYSCDVGNLKMISLDKAIEIVRGGEQE